MKNIIVRIKITVILIVSGTTDPPPPKKSESKSKKGDNNGVKKKKTRLDFKVFHFIYSKEKITSYYLLGSLKVITAMEN